MPQDFMPGRLGDEKVIRKRQQILFIFILIWVEQQIAGANHLKRNRKGEYFDLWLRES